jgi:hypothetical protein
VGLASCAAVLDIEDQDPDDAVTIDLAAIDGIADEPARPAPAEAEPVLAVAARTPAPLALWVRRNLAPLFALDALAVVDDVDAMLITRRVPRDVALVEYARGCVIGRVHVLPLTDTAPSAVA